MRRTSRCARMFVTVMVMIATLICSVHIAYAQIIPESHQTLSPFKNATYTHNAIHAGDTLVYGIDISQWNVVKDWNAVKNSGVEYVFVRVGNRWSESGKLDYDTNYKSNIEGALNAGLQVGVYFYSQAITPEEARAEAAYTMDLIRGYNITLPVVMDFEYYSNSSGNNAGRLYNARLSRRAATDVVLAFCDEVSDAGYKPMVYANKSMLSSDLYAGEIEAVAKIWVAHFTTAASYSGAHYGWQYTETGSVPGINGNVDCNFFYEPTSTAPEITDLPVILDPDATLANAAAKFPDAASITVSTANGNEKGSELPLATGDILTVTTVDGTTAQYTICVLGDVNGDATVDIFDPMDMYLYFNGDLPLEGAFLTACDFNGDGEADIFDPMDIYIHLNN